VLYPYIISPEKKRNINNDLAVLLSHDIETAEIVKELIKIGLNKVCDKTYLYQFFNNSYSVNGFRKLLRKPFN